MKLSLNKILALAGLTALFAANSAQAVTVGINTSINGAGTQLTESVVVSDLGNEIVSAFDLDMTFDAALLNPLSGTLDPGGLMGFALGGGGVVSPGLIDAFNVSLESDADLQALQAGSGSITLVEVVYDILGTGDYGLGLINWGTDPTTGNTNDIKGLNAAVIYQGTPVPEPATLALLGLGLVGVAALRRRRAS